MSANCTLCTKVQILINAISTFFQTKTLVQTATDSVDLVGSTGVYSALEFFVKRSGSMRLKNCAANCLFNT